MVGKTSQQTGTVWELAQRQHGVVARRQLLALGYGTRSIEHRVRSGRLHPLWRGVYSVGRPTVTREGRWMGAVLSCGDRAVLSHGSAAALWGIGRERGTIEVSTPVSSRAKRDGFTIHRRTGLGPADLTVHHRIPVTTPALTILDHGARLGRVRMERMINEADKLGLIKPPQLRAFLDAHPRREGVARLKALLDRRTFRYTEPGLEQAFLPLAAQAGLPIPLTQQRVNGFKVDFYWPELGLVVETDGLTYHRTPAAQARDRLRDQAHTASGLTALRFTHEQVKYEPDHVRRVLVGTVARLSRRGA